MLPVPSDSMDQIWLRPPTAVQRQCAGCPAPGGVIVDSGVVRQLQPALAGNIHHIDVRPPARRVHTCGPRKGQKLPLGDHEARQHNPSQSVAAYWRRPDPWCKSVFSCAPACPGDLRVGARIPGGRYVGVRGWKSRCAGYRRLHPQPRSPNPLSATTKKRSSFHRPTRRRLVAPPAVPAGKLTNRPSSKEYVRMSTHCAQRGEGDARIVRRDARRERNRSQVRHGVLILPVVVHLQISLVPLRELTK